MTAGVSVMAWVRPVSTGVLQTLVSRSTVPGFRGGNDASRGYALRLGPGGDVSWEVDDPSSMVPEVLTVGVSGLFDVGWHHVAATWQPGSMAIFVDGVEVGRQVSRSASINAAASTAFMIGGEQGTSFGFTGSIDEVMVFNRAIAAAEVAGCVPPPPTISTLAGGGVGDGGLAVNAPVDAPEGVAVDAAGNMYIADSGNNRVRKVSTSGTITTVAGNGSYGFSGDGGPATNASLSYPTGVAVDAAGNLYIADRNNSRVRRVSTSGTITTFAGTGMFGFSGDGGPATGAMLHNPYGVAVDTAGNLYIADYFNSRVRKVSTSGMITTVAGNGFFGSSGDGGPATSASLSYPSSVAVDAAGNVYIADTYNSRVRKVSSSGTITTVAGNGTSGFSGDGGPATSARLRDPQGVAVDAAGNLYIADSSNNRVRKVSASGTITTIAGTGSPGFFGNGLPGTRAFLYGPSGVAVDTAGNLYIADSSNNRVRKVSTSGTITTVAGNGSSGHWGDGGTATNAGLASPWGVAVDAAGNLYIADSDNHRVRKVSMSGTITTIAGTGSYGFSGDGGPATNASLAFPTGVAVDAAGNVYIADSDNHRVRKVSMSGTITTVAGSGPTGYSGGGYSGDGGPATGATLNNPYGVAVDTSGSLYIADTYNSRVRKVSTSGTITTIAGSTTQGLSGDGGPATDAGLAFPYGVAVDSAGNVYIADTDNHRVRKVSTSGTITTIAGSGTTGYSGGGYSGDGGPATSARLFNPYGVAVDAAGNVYIADTDNSRVREVSTLGTITTIAGTGSFGLSGDGGRATIATLYSPYGVAVDMAGNLYVADTYNNRIRKVSASS
jgi:uncharacterized protein YjiK